jgi:hypothetical protein
LAKYNERICPERAAVDYDEAGFGFSGRAITDAAMRTKAS